MAIQNASDLLVYAKTTDPAEQVTRVYVKTATPFELEDGETTGKLTINNITNATGVIYDAIETIAFDNTGTDVLAKIGSVLAGGSGYGYEATTTATSGDYSYRDFTNGAVGIVPTLEVLSGTTSPIATINEGDLIIEITTPGSSAIFDPVAFSTSASFSTNMDLRDVTNKDSDGWSESLAGLKSFEVSTDILQSINPDVPLDGTDFFDKLKARSLVDLSFSDRIRNIIRTNLTQSGLDGFGLSDVTQINLQDDEDGTNFASKITSTTTDWDRLSYTIDATRLEGKKLTWSFWVKGSGSTTTATWVMSSTPSGTAYAVTQDIGYSDEIISGDGDIEAISGSNARKVTGLSTSTWTRVAISLTLPINITNGDSSFLFNLYPGLATDQSSDSIYTCFWQIELTPEATDYQDPTDITHWQGNALVSSVSFDAGVEDNLTCSASFTGTGQIYPNGLGPELIEDTGFDDPSYWTLDPVDASLSVVEDGYAKIKTNPANDASYVAKLSIMNPTDFYLLEYTVAQQNTGGIFVTDGWGTQDVLIPVTVATHKVIIKAGISGLYLKRSNSNNDIWLSSISLKKVL